MGNNWNEKDSKVVNLGEKRKKKLFGSSKRQGANGASPYAKTKISTKVPKMGYSSSRVMTYIQVIIFIGAMAYLMQLCQGVL